MQPGVDERARYPFALDLAGFFTARLQADPRGCIAGFENDREPPRRHIAQGRNVGERNPPILADVDMAHRATEAMGLVVADKAIDQGASCHQLHFGIERAANRKAALVELLFAVAIAEFPADFFGEKAGGESIGRENARIDAERLGLGLFAVLARDITVLDHAVDHPIAPLDRPFALQERMIIVGGLRQGGEIGDLCDA